MIFSLNFVQYYCGMNCHVLLLAVSAAFMLLSISISLISLCYFDITCFAATCCLAPQGVVHKMCSCRVQSRLVIRSYSMPCRCVEGAEWFTADSN